GRHRGFRGLVDLGGATGRDLGDDGIVGRGQIVEGRARSVLGDAGDKVSDGCAAKAREVTLGCRRVREERVFCDRLVHVDLLTPRLAVFSRRAFTIACILFCLKVAAGSISATSSVMPTGVVAKIG